MTLMLDVCTGLAAVEEEEYPSDGLGDTVSGGCGACDTERTAAPCACDTESPCRISMAGQQLCRSRSFGGGSRRTSAGAAPGGTMSSLGKNILRYLDSILLEHLIVCVT